MTIVLNEELILQNLFEGMVWVIIFSLALAGVAVFISFMSWLMGE